MQFIHAAKFYSSITSIIPRKQSHNALRMQAQWKILSKIGEVPRTYFIQ